MKVVLILVTSIEPHSFLPLLVVFVFGIVSLTAHEVWLGNSLFCGRTKICNLKKIHQSIKIFEAQRKRKYFSFQFFGYLKKKFAYLNTPSGFRLLVLLT
jgi:hypothetical protein